MQTMKTLSWCDHPDCLDNIDFSEYPEGQEVRPLLVWVYAPGRGRKPNTVRVDVCEDHEAELKALYSMLRKNGSMQAAPGEDLELVSVGD